MFRRSRAWMELGYLFRALNDISHCLRNQTPGESNFQSYYWEVRMTNMHYYLYERYKCLGS